MSLISKEHFNLALQSIKKLLSFKVDKNELQEEISKIPQSDWNQNDENAMDYIKNRTHYETIEYGEWSEEQNLTLKYDESSGIYYSSISCKIYPGGGNMGVEINWQGTVYKCEQKYLDGMYYVGNTNIADSEYEDTGEPFVFSLYEEDWKYGLDAKTDTGEVSYSFRSINKVKKKLDEGYIPQSIARADDVNSDIDVLAKRAGIVYYGICYTVSSTNAKLVNLQNGLGNFKLKQGAVVSVKFINSNTTASPMLNVSSTGEKPIRLLSNSPSDSYYWQPYSFVTFLYDGNYWSIISITPGKATTSYYGVTKLSSSTTSTSRTEAATPNAVKSAYDLANAALPKSGGTMTGALTLSGEPTDNLHAATKKYVDERAVASDWNQNDETAIDYINNRPFGIKVIETYKDIPASGDNYGQIYDLDFANLLYEHRKTAIYTINYKGDSTLTCSFLQDEKITDTEADFYLDRDDHYVRIDLTTGRVAMYLDYLTGYYGGSITIPINEITKLDEKYIPDTIARTSDIPAQVQSDWNQNDESVVDFIKNKPEVADDDDALDILVELKFVEPIAALDGLVYTDNTGRIYTL